MKKILLWVIGLVSLVAMAGCNDIGDDVDRSLVDKKFCYKRDAVGGVRYDVIVFTTNTTFMYYCGEKDLENLSDEHEYAMYKKSGSDIVFENAFFQDYLGRVEFTTGKLDGNNLRVKYKRWKDGKLGDDEYSCTYVVY